MANEPPEQTHAGGRHSALAEFQRDERRPAVILLAMLLVAALFFALGIMVGRWTATDANPRAVDAQTDTTPARTTTPAN